MARATSLPGFVPPWRDEQEATVKVHKIENNIMNRLFLCSALLLLGVGSLFAEPQIPDSAWEQHPEGIAVAMTFSSHNENNVQKNVITIYMKNTSNLSAYYVGTEGFHREVALFLVDKAGEETPLRDYSPQPGSKILAPEIKPGETLSRTVDLSPEEMALIKGHPIKCRLNFLNISENKIVKHYAVKSTPKVLIADP